MSILAGILAVLFSVSFMNAARASSEKGLWCTRTADHKGVTCGSEKFMSVPADAAKKTADAATTVTRDRSPASVSVFPSFQQHDLLPTVPTAKVTAGPYDVHPVDED